MTKDQLVARLKEMREAGEADPRGRATAMHLLFGIIFDKEIEAIGSNGTEIARAAGLPAEGGISDGRALAGYVTVKDPIEKRWRCGGG